MRKSNSLCCVALSTRGSTQRCICQLHLAVATLSDLFLMSTISCCFFHFFVHYFFRTIQTSTFANSQMDFCPSPSFHVRHTRSMHAQAPTGAGCSHSRIRRETHPCGIPNVHPVSRGLSWTLTVPLPIQGPAKVLSGTVNCSATDPIEIACLLFRALRGFSTGLLVTHTARLALFDFLKHPFSTQRSDRIRAAISFFRALAFPGA